MWRSKFVAQAGLVVCIAACGDEPGTPDEPGAVTATQSGQATEPMAGVELTCDSAGPDGGRGAV